MNKSGTATEAQTESAGADSVQRCVRCPACGQKWPKDCEQAVRVEMFGGCFACLADGQDWHINEVIHERVKRLEAQGIEHDYDLREYPIGTPNVRVSEPPTKNL